MLMRRLERLFGAARVRRAPRPGPAFEVLEDRILLAAQPVVALDVPASALIGGTVQATATFTNVPNGAPGSANGFGPILDLVLPHNGADGAGVGSTPPVNNDGIALNTASYLGINLAVTQVEFDAAGHAAHPYLRDAAGNPLIVNAADFGAAPGDMLASIQLPFGSVTPGQTPISVKLGLQVSNLADVDTPLPITARGAFQFGRDAANNPSLDPPVLGAITAPSTVTPTIMEITKSFSGPEGETVTGPNSPRTYTINLNVAPGQTISDVTIEDQFADGIVVLAGGIAAPGGTINFNAGTNHLTVDFAAPVTGGVSITVPFYVGEFLAPTTPAAAVLPPLSGASRAMGNDVSATADWTPLDPRDPTINVILNPDGFENVFTAKSLAVQKTVALQTDVLGNGAGPDDTLQYTIRGQISDYFAFGNLLLTDLLSDGQHLDAGFTPTITLHEGTTNLSTTFVLGSSFSVTRSSVTGISTLDFNLSQLMIDNGADALLNGDPTGTLGVTSFTIAYRAVIDRTYLAAPQLPVTQNDHLGNQVSFAGQVDLDGTPGGITGGNVTDNSSSSVTVTAGASDKSVYALNGQIVTGPVTIVAGDTVTFRLTRSFPQSTAADFTLTDFLPLPIFNVAAESFSFVDVVSGTAPADGVVQWGPLAGAFRTLYGALPTLGVSSANNSLSFDFGDIGNGTPVSTTLDLLFTVTVQDRPLGDQLLLTNLATATETNSAGAIITDNDIAQVTLSEPVLKVYKGVVATSDPGATFSPGAVGPVPFTAPGTAGLRFTGVINSTNLATTPIDSDLRGVDAGDKVTFAVIVENTGTGKNGAFDIQFQDLLPQRLTSPGGVQNLHVTDGAGNLLAYTLDTNNSILGLKFTLNDAPGAGALAAYSATSGRNILVVTFDATLSDRVEPRSQLTNTASVLGFAAFEGGLNRAPNAPAGSLTDTATVEVEAVQIAKAVVATSIPETTSIKGNPNLPDLAIGETVTFDITITLPEGQVLDLVLQDLLPLSPGKLKVLEAQVVSIGANIRDGLVNLLSLPAGVITDRNNDGILDTVTWTAPGSVINIADNISDAKDQIVLRVVATVPDVSVNSAGDRLTNTANVTYAVGSVGTVTEQATAAVELVEPKFILTKTASPTTAVAGDTVTYTVTFQPGPDQSFSGPAFNAVLDDPLILGKVALEHPFTVTSTAAYTPLPGPGVQLSFPVLLPTDTVTIVYTGKLDPLVVAGEQLVNTVTTTALSAPNPALSGTDQRPYALNDSAIVNVPGAGITKVVSGTSLPETGSSIYNGSITDLAIGETVDFTITLTLPRALSQSLTLVDILPNDSGVSSTSGVLTAWDAQILSIGSSLTGAAPNITLTGSQVTITFGDVLNDDTGLIVGANEKITVLIRATLVNDPGNVARDVLTNRATVSADTGSGIISRSATAQVEVVEPNLSINKSGDLGSGDAGDIVTYTVTVPRGPNSGPAFDVSISDPLAADLRGVLGSGVIVSGPASAVIDYIPLTNSFTVTAASYLTTDPLLTFTYQARIAPAAFPGEAIINTASVTWDSYRGTPPALPQGDQRLYGPVSDSYQTTVPGVSISKVVSGTDGNPTGDGEFNPLITDMVIGERVLFTITLRLPEGTTTLTLTDFLPVATGNEALSGRLAYESSQITAIGSSITGSLLGVGAAGVYDPATNTVTFNFGTVVNQADNVNDAEDRITLSLIARLVNVPENRVGDLLTNTARVDFTGGTASDTAQVEVVGPVLQLTKTADKATADAGDIITYTVTIPPDPSSTSTAFLLQMVDYLGPGLALIPGSVTTTQTSVGDGFVLTGNNPGDTYAYVFFVSVARTEPTPVITYQARVTDAVVAGSTIPNTAQLRYQSWVDQGRIAPDLAAMANFTVPVPTLAKTIAATSLTETGSSQFVPTVTDLALGETVTYRLTATLIEGTQALRIADALPTGLTPLSASVVSLGDGTNITGAALGAGAAGTISGQNVTFDFGGAVVNRGDNITTNNTVVVEVVARATNFLGLTAGTTLTNAARLDYGAGFGAAVTAPIEIVIPDLLLTKSVTPPARGDAGDVMTYTVTVAHSGTSTGPAFDLTLTDLLAGEKLDYVAGSATASLGGSSVGSFDTTGGNLRYSLGTLGLTAGTLTITYQAKLADTVEPGGVVVNSVALQYDTAPGTVIGERVFTPPPETATVTVVMPATLDKSITATSIAATPDGQVAPGETITYTLVTRLSEGTQKVVVADTLPGDLQVVSANVVGFGTGITNSAGLTAGSAGVIAGQGVSFDFGTVVNPGDNSAANDTVTVQIIARVRDTAPGGAVLTNAAITTVTDTAGGNIQQPTDAVTVTVVLPDLLLTKSVAAPASGDAGDVMTYTVTVAHSGTSTGPAFDLTLTDLLAGEKLNYVAGSATASLGGTSVGSFDTTGGNLRYSLGTLGLTAGTLTITYQAKLADTVEPGGTVVNSVALRYDTAPGTVIGERVFTPPPETATVTVVMPATLDKSITATSIAATPDGQVAPGETITYTLVTRLSEGTQKVVVADTLPGDLQVVSANVVGFGTGITNSAGLTAGSAGVIAGQGVSFDFGTVVNPGDNNAANDTVTVQIIARVRDTAPGGAVLTNAAITTVTDTAGGNIQQPTDAVTVTVVLPDLLLTKSVAAPASGDAGDVMTYTVTVAHSGTSTGPAFDLTLTDLLAGEKLNYVAGSATASLGGTSVGSFDTTGGNLRYSLGTLGLTAGMLTITYQAKLADTVEPGGTVVNSVALRYDTAPGTVIGERVFTPPPETATVTVVMPATLTKTITATDIAATPDGKVAPGETVTYTLVTTISEGTQKLVVADAMPTGMEVISASVVAIGSGITNTAGLLAGSAGVIAGQGVSFDFGTVVNPGDNNAANDIVTVQIIARVRDATAVGTVLTNAAITTVTDTADGNIQQPTDAVSVTVVTPVLALTKAVESYTPGDAGTEAVFVVTLSHVSGSTGPAFGTITDALPGGLRDAVILSVTGPAGTASITGDTITVPITAGGFLTTDPNIVIRFSARLSDSVEHLVTVTNEASATYRPSPNGGIPVTLTDDASVTPIFTPAFTKTLASTNNADTAGNAVAIGEIVTYRLSAILAEGTQNFVLTDVLPIGMQLLDATIRYSTTAITAPAYANGAVVALSGTSFTLDFGTVVNAGDNQAGNNAVDVLVRARVMDISGLDAGDRLVNAAVMTPTTTAGIGIGAPLTDNAPIVVVEPELVLAKSVQGFARPGETAPYTIVLRHDATSTAVAYDVAVADLLQDPGLSLVAGSAVVTDNVGGATGASVTSNNGTLGVFVPRLAMGEEITIHFTAFVATTTIPTTTLPNTATVNWTSSPGVTIGERAYVTDADAVLRLAPVLTKEIIATSVPETTSSQFNPALPDLAIGETVTYRLSVLLPQALLTGVTLTDLLPEGLTPLGAMVESVGSAVAGITVGSAGSISGQAVVFGFGTVLNTGSTAVGAEDAVTILVTARTTNAGINVAGRLLTNTASLGFTINGESGTQDAAASAEIVTPELNITKTVTPDYQAPGSSVTHGLTVTHTASSTQDAFDVVVSDAANGSAVELGSVVVTGTSEDPVVTYQGTGFVVNLRRLGLGEVMSISYRAILDNVPPGSGQVVNTATLLADSLPDGNGIPQFMITDQDQARVTVSGGLPPDQAAQGGMFGAYRTPDGNLRFGIRPDLSFAGAASPGASLSISLRDSLGRVVANVDALADLGGNWLANLTGLVPPGTNLPNTDDYLSRTRLFTSMASTLTQFQGSLLGDMPFGSIADGPYTVEITARRGIGEMFDETAQNSRVYYHDLTTGGAFVSDGGLTLRDIFAGTASRAIPRLAAAAFEPYSFDINKFAAEFLSAGAIPGVANR